MQHHSIPSPCRIAVFSPAGRKANHDRLHTAERQSAPVSGKLQAASAGQDVGKSPDPTSPFLVPLFDILTSQGENKDFHPYRAPRRDCDHRHSCRYAPARIGSGEREGKRHSMRLESEAGRSSVEVLLRRLGLQYACLCNRWFDRLARL